MSDCAYGGQALCRNQGIGVVERPCGTCHEGTCDAECGTCGEVEGVEGECPGSKRTCGHHCNCVWEHGACDWCPAHTNDDGELVSGR